MYKCLLIAIAVTLSSAALAQRQIHHSSPLCDDYVRLKTQEYLDKYETANYDDYMTYKAEVSQYCSEMLRSGDLSPASGGDWGYNNEGIGGTPRNYNLSLD